jgi:hypothetical protein
MDVEGFADPLDAFVIHYNGVDVPVSKYKFALYSTKFRGIPNFDDSVSAEAVGQYSLSTFSQFISGAQGYPIEISEDNCLDLLSLCEEWETPTLGDLVMKFISKSANCEQICSRLLEHNENLPDEALESVLAENLNRAIELPSFRNFPLATLHRILTSPRISVDPHTLLRFVMDMFDRYHEEASPLAQSVDIRKLSRAEAEEFLSSPWLIPTAIGDSLRSTTLTLLTENDELKSRVQQTENVIETLLQRMQSIESQFASAPAHPQPGDIDEKLKRLGDTILAEADKKIADSEARSHGNLRKTNKTVNGLTRKSTEYDAHFKALDTQAADTKQLILDFSRRAQFLENSFADFQESRKVMRLTDCEFNGRPFAGILNHLSSLVNGNVHLAKVVVITASTTDHSEPYHVADVGWNDLWFSENRADQWLMLDFGEKRVKVTHYTIKTHKYPAGACHIKSWVVEGSKDGQGWVNLDKRNISLLNGPNKFQTFPCTGNSEAVRFVRLRQTGVNSRNDRILALTNFELFGSLFSPDD